MFTDDEAEREYRRGVAELGALTYALECLGEWLPGHLSYRVASKFHEAVKMLREVHDDEQ